jgi:hypothetical protein
MISISFLPNELKSKEPANLDNAEYQDYIGKTLELTRCIQRQ